MRSAERFHNAEAPLHAVENRPLLLFLTVSSRQENNAGGREGAARDQKNLRLEAPGGRQSRIVDFLYAGAYQRLGGR